MNKLFDKILVPLDFNEISKQTAVLAIEFAVQYNCRRVHFMHVVDISPFAAINAIENYVSIPYLVSNNSKELEYQMDKHIEYAQTFNTCGIEITQSVFAGAWNELIIDVVNKDKFDLVLIGQKRRLLLKRSMQMNPDRIALNTNIPVITIPVNRGISNLTSVIIPVTTFLPLRKLIYGAFIASKNNARIELVAVEEKPTEIKSSNYLKTAYQFLRDNFNIRVGLSTTTSKNIADAVNNSAMLKSADLIVVNPGTQTKMPGLFSALLGNTIQKYATAPVLTINAGNLSNSLTFNS